MIEEHDRVALKADLPEHNLCSGDIGVIVLVHGDYNAYELEIFDSDGHTLDVITVDATQVYSIADHAT